MASEKYRDVMDEFKKIGRMIWEKELNNSHSGNMSVRVGDRILITRRGSMLGFLKDSDIIETGLERNDSGISLTSTEVNVHRAIYQGASCLAIVHSHPLTATALTFVQDEIIAIDVEGSYYLRKIPIVEFEFGTSSKEMEEELPKVLKNYKICMVKGHGAFAIGDYLEEALQYSHMVESIARIIFMTKMLGGDLAKIQKGMYSTW
ncbi:MAG: class II aldolase/adducin family protein [bacterium]|nr:MAG: class II aldolase/adducin family protein [bacterium]